jgi:hypothetical protein
MIKQVLAAGVHGLLLCHAEAPEAVRAFVEAARYSFMTSSTGSDLGGGRRGHGGQIRAAEIWGIPVDQYFARADPWPLNPRGELLLGIKVENTRALACVERTTRVPGIAFAEWGPGDMGMSMGYPDQHDEPYPAEMQAARTRIMTACKANLREECVAGRFREDLYFRLNVLSIEIPSLRDRMEDVPLLFHWFVSQSAERGNRPCPPVDTDALTQILQHDWPGNVRELQNAAIRHAMGLDLGIGGMPNDSRESTLADRMAYLEKQLVHHELQRNGGDLKTTYESLGVSRKTLYDKMRKYGLGRPPADDE